MLIDFSMENFKSFKDKVTLSSEAGQRLSKYKKTNTLDIGRTSVLKNLLVFGPNGAGKSNLLDGIKTMKNMVLNDPAKATDSLPINLFQLDPELLEDEPQTTFCVDFKRNSNEFKYEFSYNQKMITREELTINNKKTPYFKRVGKRFEILPKELVSVSKRTKPNSLFLFTAQQNNDFNAIEVVTWFDEDLIFVGDYSRAAIPDNLALLIKNNSVKEQLLRFLHFADFNITDIEVIDSAKTSIPVSGYSIPLQTNRTELFTMHKEYGTDGVFLGKTKKMPIDSESRGTQKILMIALSIINAELNDNGKTLLFDEFDDSLHLELSQALIKIFNSEANKNQFILTTHELQLLDSKVRVDQIYFVEKDFHGISDLSSIFDFNDPRNISRSGVSYMKRYLEGRFGAKPIIDSDEMLESLGDIKGKGPNHEG
ncbi:ATP/GTP-binding protein [Lactiplantibacillus nangangensis]|uniref:ATP/GTP-binding protein n=1 Tax=Lactiplantibacillus nangangensis TaxID=2559917 RepID=A0ABW1SG65_9LACO|nr:ATP-binding protein [Lactiplantibacillus nangangensis]